MKNKIKQFHDKLEEMTLLAKEIREELVQDGYMVMAEIYSIQAPSFGIIQGN